MYRKPLTVLLMLLIVINLFFTSCSYNSDTEQIKYYTIAGSVNLVDILVYKYNETSGLSENEKIKIIEFDDQNTLSNVMSSEIMAGEGPDLLSLATLSYGNTSINKLLQQGIFADINAVIDADMNKNKIDFTDYCEAAMNAGVYENKRIIIPLSYVPNILISSEGKCSSYINNDNLTYDEIISINQTLSDEDNVSLFEYEDEYESLFLDFIDENLNINDNTHNFDSHEFIETVKNLKEIILNMNKNEQSSNNTGLFTASETFNLLFTCENLVNKININEKPVLFNKPTMKGDFTADIYDAIAINNNSNDSKKQKVLKFIEYALSEEVQNDFCGANTKDFDINSYTGLYYPVNNNSLNKIFTTASQLNYSEKGIKIDTSVLDYISKTIRNINVFNIATSYDYYNNHVINDIVFEYLNGNLSDESFIYQLKSKTSIYIEE